MISPTGTLFAANSAKSFIHVSGAEAAGFLQSLLTANMDLIAPGQCAPAALLTPQGRVLHDMMIYHPKTPNNAPPNDAIGSYIIEVEAAGRDDLFTRLRRYRLRRPIDLALEDNLALWLGWGAPKSDNSYTDPRHPTLGMRWLGPINDTPPFADSGTMTDINVWHAVRILAGVPEGPVDLTPERALMLEAGLDQLGAVDFTKGCYIGQEVTARTHYRGLVKRRLVPLRLATSTAPDPGTAITLDGTAIATTKTSAISDDNGDGGAVCLALLKLSEIHAALAGDITIKVGEAKARPDVPDWMMPLPDPARTDNKTSKP
jgi:folate-binding protein YgfZ